MNGMTYDLQALGTPALAVGMPVHITAYDADPRMVGRDATIDEIGDYAIWLRVLWPGRLVSERVVPVWPGEFEVTA